MMLTLIAETESVERQHRNALHNLMKQTEGTVRIASAYVTDTRLLSGLKGRDVRLLTYISKMDIIVQRFCDGWCKACCRHQSLISGPRTEFVHSTQKALARGPGRREEVFVLRAIYWAVATTL
jgi:hypothetical protein